MARFLIGRLLSVIPVLLVVTTIVFLALRLGPGDPAAILAGDSATPEMIAAMRAHLGLDQSLPQQFVGWAAQIMRGDFGRSITSNQPVVTLIAARLQPTLALALGTILFSILVATPLGVLAAWRRGTWIDTVASGGAVIGFASRPSSPVICWFICLRSSCNGFRCRALRRSRTGSGLSRGT